MTQHQLILIPPLLMPALGMKPLQWRLAARGHSSSIFRYRSYSRTISENARLLAEEIKSRGLTSFDAVTFSMGALVLRWAVNYFHTPPPRRVIMIGPPNRGSSMADWADRMIGPGFPLLFGRSARDLRTGELGLTGRAGCLPMETEVAIIAGGTGRVAGFNPIIGRDNDRVVAVDETLLEGMKSFTRLPIPHGPLVFSPETAALCDAFLRTGSFGNREMEPPQLDGSPRPLAA